MSTPFEQGLNPVPFVDLTDWEYSCEEPDADTVWPADTVWKPGGRTYIWDNDQYVVWHRQEWTVPADWAGKTVVFDVVSRARHELRVDGELNALGPYGVLTTSAEAGRTYRFLIRIDRDRRPGMLLRARMTAFPAYYQQWLDVLSRTASLVPGKGQLLEEWHHKREENGNYLAAPEVDHSDWPLFALGAEWREENSCYWYRSTVTVPDEILGHRVAGQPLRLTAGFNGRGSIWVDGEQKAEYGRDFGHAVVSESAQPGNQHVLAIRVPTTWSGWLQNTYFVPESLAVANEAIRRLQDELEYWRRYFLVRPDEQFIRDVIEAVTPLISASPTGPELAPMTETALEALAACREKFVDEAPFLSFPYQQMPKPDGVIIRAESLFDRSSTITLYHPDGQVTEHIQDGDSRFHRHDLRGLETDTEYHYELRAGNVVAPRMSFCTAPEGFQPLTIVSWGDSHYGPDISENIAKHVAEIKPDLVLTAGDMVGDGYYEWQFIDDLLHPMRYAKGVAPVQFAVGNHDHGSWLMHDKLRNPYWESRFEPTGDAPGDNPYCCSFDYAGCHFVFVDPYFGRVESRSDGITPGKPQYEWLDADLAAAKDARWTLLYIHEPPFCETWEGAYYDGEVEVREYLVPLMEKHGVDMCIAGHAHTYERGMPHPPYNPETGEGNTVSYLITGGGGAKMDNRKFYEWPQIDIPPHRVQETDDILLNDIGEYYKYHFCVINIDRDRLESTAYWIRTDGTIVDEMDSFILRKGVPLRG